jgi:hypothetical protein
MKRVRTLLRRARIASTLCAGLVACAGGETPGLTPQQAEDVAVAYAGGRRAATPGDESGAVAGAGAKGASSAASSGAGADLAAAAGGSAGAPSAAGDGGGTAGTSGSANAGAGGPANAAGGTAGTGASIPCDGFAVVAANCGTSGCHGQGSNLEAFATSEAAARTYIGSPGTLACSGQGDVIDADDPPASLMLTKLSDDPPCGQPMPLSGSPLTAAEIQCIEEWLGAL